MNNNYNSARIMKISMTLFYLIIIMALIICGSLWFDSRESFYVNTKSVSLIVNDNYSIGIYGKNKKKPSNYIYTSSNTSIATVDSNGIVHAVSEGEVTITVKSKFSKKNKQINISIEGDTIYSIDVEQDVYNVKVGDKFTIKTTVNENSSFYRELDYSSSDNNIVSVDQKGNVKVHKSGSAYIIIKDRKSGFVTKVLVNVEGNSVPTNVPSNNNNNNSNNYEGGEVDDPIINNNVVVKSIKLFVNKDTMVVNDTAVATYALEPINATDKRVVFESNNTKVATVDNQGNIRAIGPGSANIMVTSKSGNKTSYVTIKVVANSIPVSKITLNKNTTTIEKGGKEKLTYYIEPTNATDKKVIWTSSNTSVAVVEQDGTVKTVNTGKTIIYAKTADGKQSASCEVNVTKQKIKVKSISLNKNSLKLNMGKSEQLKVTFNPSNATNQKVSWSSSNSKVVIVDNGKIVAVGAGSATITVKSEDGNYKTTCTVTVPEIKITKLTLQKTSVQMILGEKSAINVSISPSNATNKKLKYTSSNESVAVVNAEGVVTAKKLGQATISVKASDGSGKVAKLNVVVVPKGNVIDIRKQAYVNQYYNLNVSEGNSGYAKHMQNFAITKDHIYLATCTSGCKVINASAPSEAIIKDLNRTIVFRINKNSANATNMKNKAKINSSVMYLKWSGHGQNFTADYDTGVIFTSTNVDNNMKFTRPNPAYSIGNNRWWGVQNALMQVDFKANTKDANFTIKHTYQAKNADGSSLGKAGMVSIDKENNLIGIRAGSNIRIYNYSDFLKGKYTLVYGFKYSSSLGNYKDGSSISYQGFAIKNGYFYIFRGAPGKASYVEAFNYLGENIYTSNTRLSTSNNREAEGMQIYNNRIYLGSTTQDGKGNTYMNIGYYK